MLRTLETGIMPQQRRGRFPRAIVECRVAQWIGDAKRRHAALTLAEQVAHASNAHILSRNLETVFGAREDLQPLRDIGTHVAEQDTE